MESHQQDLELDFLDAMIAERTSVDPAFPLIVEAATRRRLRSEHAIPPAADEDDRDPQ